MHLKGVPMTFLLLPPTRTNEKTQDVFCLFPWDFHWGFRSLWGAKTPKLSKLFIMFVIGKPWEFFRAHAQNPETQQPPCHSIAPSTRFANKA